MPAPHVSMKKKKKSRALKIHAKSELFNDTPCLYIIGDGEKGRGRKKQGDDYPMMLSRGRREGREGAVSIRAPSLPGISLLQINMNTHTCTRGAVQTTVGLAKVKRFTIPQEQAGRQT